jgi:DNA-binding NtrC family response regulator
MQSGTSKTVLIVDDSPELARSLGRMIKDEKITVVTMNSGEDALEYMESNSVDVIVSDVVMPNMSGIELIKRIHSRWPNIKRLLYSGYGDLAAINSVRNSIPPCHAFINSCNTEEITTTIRNFIK